MSGCESVEGTIMFHHPQTEHNLSPVDKYQSSQQLSSDVVTHNKTENYLISVGGWKTKQSF